jgi:hypothetical protein
MDYRGLESRLSAKSGGLSKPQSLYTIWKDKRRVNALDLLNDKAMTTVDLAERLSEGYQNDVDPRTVYAVLKADKRFRKIRKVMVNSISRTNSHDVWLFGRSDRTYDENHPWMAKGE